MQEQMVKAVASGTTGTSEHNFPVEGWLSCQKSDAPNAGMTAALSKAKSSLEMASWKPCAAFSFADRARKSLWPGGKWPSLPLALWQVAMPGSHGEFGKSSSTPLQCSCSRISSQ